MRFLYLIILNFVLGSAAFSKSWDVNGAYKVTAVAITPEGEAVVDFEVTDPSPQTPTLVRLNLSHVHYALKKGQVFQLKGELANAKNKVAELAQVMLELNTNEGRTPIWLMSSKHQPKKRIYSEKLLKLHAPSADYRVF